MLSYPVSLFLGPLGQDLVKYGSLVVLEILDNFLSLLEVDSAKEGLGGLEVEIQ